MPWLKYRHRFSSHVGEWEYRFLGADRPSPSALDRLCAELASRYNEGEHYRGMDRRVVAFAPVAVIQTEINFEDHAIWSHRRVSMALRRDLIKAKAKILKKAKKKS